MATQHSDVHVMNGYVVTPLLHFKNGRSMYVASICILFHKICVHTCDTIEVEEYYCVLKTREGLGTQSTNNFPFALMYVMMDACTPPFNILFYLQEICHTHYCYNTKEDNINARVVQIAGTCQWYRQNK